MENKDAMYRAFLGSSVIAVIADVEEGIDLDEAVLEQTEVLNYCVNKSEANFKVKKIGVKQLENWSKRIRQKLQKLRDRVVAKFEIKKIVRKRGPLTGPVSDLDLNDECKEKKETELQHDSADKDHDEHSSCMQEEGVYSISEPKMNNFETMEKSCMKTESSLPSVKWATNERCKTLQDWNSRLSDESAPENEPNFTTSSKIWNDEIENYKKKDFDADVAVNGHVSERDDEDDEVIKQEIDKSEKKSAKIKPCGVFNSEYTIEANRKVTGQHITKVKETVIEQNDTDVEEVERVEPFTAYSELWNENEDTTKKHEFTDDGDMPENDETDSKLPTTKNISMKKNAEVKGNSYENTVPGHGTDHTVYEYETEMAFGPIVLPSKLIKPRSEHTEQYNYSLSLSASNDFSISYSLKLESNSHVNKKLLKQEKRANRPPHKLFALSNVSMISSQMNSFRDDGSFPRKKTILGNLSSLFSSFMKSDEWSNFFRDFASFFTRDDFDDMFLKVRNRCSDTLYIGLLREQSLNNATPMSFILALISAPERHRLVSTITLATKSTGPIKDMKTWSILDMLQLIPTSGESNMWAFKKKLPFYVRTTESQRKSLVAITSQKTTDKKRTHRKTNQHQYSVSKNSIWQPIQQTNTTTNKLKVDNKTEGNAGRDWNEVAKSNEHCDSKKTIRHKNKTGSEHVKKATVPFSTKKEVERQLTCNSKEDISDTIEVFERNFKVEHRNSKLEILDTSSTRKVAKQNEGDESHSDNDPAIIGQNDFGAMDFKNYIDGDDKPGKKKHFKFSKMKKRRQFSKKTNALAGRKECGFKARFNSDSSSKHNACFTPRREQRIKDSEQSGSLEQKFETKRVLNLGSKFEKDKTNRNMNSTKAKIVKARDAKPFRKCGIATCKSLSDRVRSKTKVVLRTAKIQLDERKPKYIMKKQKSSSTGLEATPTKDKAKMKKYNHLTISKIAHIVKLCRRPQKHVRTGSVWVLNLKISSNFALKFGIFNLSQNGISSSREKTTFHPSFFSVFLRSDERSRIILETILKTFSLKHVDWGCFGSQFLIQQQISTLELFIGILAVENPVLSQQEKFFESRIDASDITDRFIRSKKEILPDVPFPDNPSMKFGLLLRRFTKKEGDSQELQHFNRVPKSRIIKNIAWHTTHGKESASTQKYQKHQTISSDSDSDKKNEVLQDHDFAFQGESNKMRPTYELSRLDCVQTITMQCEEGPSLFKNEAIPLQELYGTLYQGNICVRCGEHAENGHICSQLEDIEVPWVDAHSCQRHRAYRSFLEESPQPQPQASRNLNVNVARNDTGTEVENIGAPWHDADVNQEQRTYRAFLEEPPQQVFLIACVRCRLYVVEDHVCPETRAFMNYEEEQGESLD